MAAKYPTRAEIFELFAKMGRGDYAGFMERVSPNVEWTIMGTSPMSQKFKSLKEFQEATLNRLAKILTSQLLIQVQHVVGGGPDQAWASVEMKADATCHNGMPYNQVYNWVIKFDEKGVITHVRAYLDTKLLTEVLQSHECPVFNEPNVAYDK